MYSLSHRNIKPVMLYILIGLFAYSVAGALSGIMAERTLGGIFRHFLPTTPYLFLIVLINLYDIREFSFSSLVPHIPANLSCQLILKRFILILLLAVPMGVCVLLYLGKGGLVIGPIVILILVSLFISSFYMMSEEKIIGIIIYIATIPFLFYVQGRLFEIGLKKLLISEITIPLSAIYFTIISICFFLSKYHTEPVNLGYEEKRFFKLCMFFVLMPVFSIILSKDACHSFTYYLMDLFLPVIYFFILMRSIKTTEDIKKLILALIISTFLYQLHALYFMYRQSSAETATIQLYGSEIFTGFSYVIIPLIIPFQIALYNLLRGWKRISIGLMLLIFIIYLFLCNYRTAVGASAIGFIVFYYFLYRSTLAKKILVSISMLLLVIIAVSYIENITEKLSYFRVIQTIQRLSAGEPLEAISSGRVENWRAASAMIYDHPFWGIGPDMWARDIWQYSMPIFWYKDYTGIWRQTYAYDPHNLYLLVWVNYGIVNFICYLFILYFAVKKGLQNIKRCSSSQTQNISVATFISLIIWMVMSFFTMRFFNHSILLYALIFWSIIAVILKLNEFNSNLSIQGGSVK